MTDNFALLSEPRRPWLDPEALKQKFLTLSAAAHPDKIHAASDAAKSGAARSFAELNAAYQCLADPKARLLHLLELESAKPDNIQQIPGALADWFAEVARTCRSADEFLAEKNRATSPLLQVALFERGQEWVEKLNALQKKLNAWHAELLSELQTVDEQWSSAEAAVHAQARRHAGELYRHFSYCNRWSAQIQERVVQLSF